MMNKNKIRGLTIFPDLEKEIIEILPHTSLTFSSFTRLAIRKEIARVKVELNLEEKSE